MRQDRAGTGIEFFSVIHVQVILRRWSKVWGAMMSKALARYHAKRAFPQTDSSRNSDCRIRGICDLRHSNFTCTSNVVMLP